jgi:hypothetical protein
MREILDCIEAGEDAAMLPVFKTAAEVVVSLSICINATNWDKSL